MNKRSLLILLIMIAACAPKQLLLSDTHLSAVKFNQRAEEAYKAGNHKRALSLYQQALAKERSTENSDGIAINLMNIAAIQKELEEYEQAHKTVDQVLHLSPIQHSKSQQSQASLIKGLLFIETGDYRQAAEWADKGLSLCQKRDTRTQGKLYNLKTRTALLTGDPDTASEYALQGIRLNKKSGDLRESANSLRLYGEAKGTMHQYSEAEEAYSEALALDKKLGLSRKIAIDMMGIGNNLFSQGMLQDALNYYHRALSVSESMQDEEGMSEATEMIDKINQKTAVENDK